MRLKFFKLKAASKVIKTLRVTFSPGPFGGRWGGEPRRSCISATNALSCCGGNPQKIKAMHLESFESPSGMCGQRVLVENSRKSSRLLGSQTARLYAWPMGVNSATRAATAPGDSIASNHSKPIVACGVFLEPTRRCFH